MPANRWACTAFLCLAGLARLAAPAAAQAPDTETTVPDLEEDAPAADEEVPAGETIEISGKPILETARSGGEEMSRAEVESLPGGRGDAFETVRSMPGVAFASAFDGAGDLVVRGTRGSDSWYLIDGMPVPQSMHFGNITAVLPAEMIESIELLPGGFDVEYGRATGGVVEIRTRRSRPERFSGVADVSFIHASAFVQGPLWGDELSFSASFRRSFIDLLTPMFLGDDSDFSFTSPPRYSDAQVRLDWLPDYRHEVSVLGLFSDDALGVQLDTENAQDPLLTGDIGTSDSFWRVIASWRFDGARFGSRAALSYGGAIERIHLNETHFVDSNMDEFTGREDLRLEVADWLRLRAGGDVRVLPWDLAVRMPVPPGEGRPDSNFTTSPTIDLDQDKTYLEAGGYLAADVRPIDRLTVTPGLRVDHYQHIEATVPQPRLAADLRIGKGWSTRASIGRFSRPHAVAEAIPEDLQPETAIHLTGGIEQHFTPGVRASVTGFHTWLNDLAVYDPALVTGDDVIEGFVSRGEGTVRGFEVLMRFQRDDLFAWLAYTYSQSRRVDAPGMPERAFDYDQPHNLVAAASWKLGAWTLGGRFRYASGLLHTPIVGSVYVADKDVYEPTYGRLNSERLEVSHQLDVRVDRRFTFDSWRLSAYLDVSNAYANGRVLDYSYDFDYSEREPLTDLLILPSIGVRGEF